MKIKTLIALVLGIFFTSGSLKAQKIDAAILQKRWAASWITLPNAPSNGYGVYLFRKILEINVLPTNFIIHVSADNRYKLYINEKLVSLGPARGDLSHWNFETVDLAPYLKTGKNSIAAQVWNEAEWRPEAQITAMTGFILQGNTKTEQVLNTGSSWRCVQDSSYAPVRVTGVRGYYVAGAGEARQMALSPKNWTSLNFDDRAWKSAKSITSGLPKDNFELYGASSQWLLVPSGIPQMEMKVERFGKLAQKTGEIAINQDFLKQKTDIVVPSNTTITLLLDQTYLTNAYPMLVFSGGKNAQISLAYAEALYEKGMSKGNRNDTQGKEFVGREDKMTADGSQNQQFTTLNYRTYRYVQVKIKTQEEALTLNDIYGVFTGYPFQLKSNLSAATPEMTKMLDIGWRTARLCATETYMDCPYYEQLQYIGDARIQALVTLYNTGDERMVKNALNLMDYSRQPEGVTESRHPSYSPQYIPTFSLWYIGMVHDYAHYGNDLAFIKQKIGGTRQILDYFKNYQQADGSLKNVPNWMFTDWVDNQKDWKAGIAPMSPDGTSAPIDLQLLLAYQTAVDLENKLGIPAFAAHYKAQIEQLKKTIQAKYWDNKRQLYADRAERDVFSQHTNCLAILTGLISGKQVQNLAQKILSEKDLAPASIYFKYYLHQAFIKAGLGNDYLKWLDKWRENIQLGLTTWAEMSDVHKSRSDCHAWGSSPNIEFYRTILGIDSDGLGFSKVKITPHLGELTDIGGTMPHPKGSIVAHYKREKNKWAVQIELPKTITGVLAWKGKNVFLKEGLNKLSL
ncbi:MAG: alpha-rhamnosidase [Saprospiraceae bacterium]|nr:alpha-rhamnosidase [Saprospiraceae bacterium]